MNELETELYRIVDAVVECCSTQIDENGSMSLTRKDVLGKSRAENVVMTRCILVEQLVGAGFSYTTVSQLLHRTIPAIRHMLEMSANFKRSSRAYRIAEAESTIMCKDVSKAIMK